MSRTAGASVELDAVPLPRRRVAARWAVGALLVVSTVGGFLLVRAVTDDAGHVCSRLGARVDGLDGFQWDNGITSSGSEWANVLTSGITDAAAPERAGIAHAVRGDVDGYRRLREAMPDELVPVVDRLRSLVVDPVAAESRNGDADVRRDEAALRAFGIGECGLV